MCTLTIIAHENGYYLGMNRDEQIARGVAMPPAISDFGATKAIYPRDGAGGTWVAANTYGIALALLNWNDVPQPTGVKTPSRGEVIPALIASTSFDRVETALQGLNLQGIWPFRLVGVFPEERRIAEWRWDQRALAMHSHDWKAGHWFSSSLSDESAAKERGAVCESAWKESDAGSVSWQRRLHGSHANGPGPFSLCVHRENVETLSYTEISCGSEQIQCQYLGNSPCSIQQLTFEASSSQELLATVTLPNVKTLNRAHTNQFGARVANACRHSSHRNVIF